MSGGLWDYKDKYLKYEIFGWDCDKPTNVFEDIEISHLIYDVFKLLHDFDWYQCGDTGEDDWLKAKHKFKSKWLVENDARTKELIDSSIEDLKQELYKSFEGAKQPLPPETLDGINWVCPHCKANIRGWTLSGGIHYCDCCGEPINWDNGVLRRECNDY